MKKAIKFGVMALAIVGLVGCAGGGSSGGGKKMTDEQMVKQVVDAAMASLTAQDIDGMVANYADDFKSDQGGGKPEMVEFLKGAKEQGFLDGIKIDQSKTVIAVNGEKATVKPINLEGSFGALTLEFEMTKRDGKWLVTYQAQY